ncbi:MAG: ATP-binding protein [Thermomicrobiales bacterium]
MGHETVRLWQRRLPWSPAAVEPWRLLVGTLSVLLPAMVLALLDPALPVTTPGVVLLVAVAFSASLADWAGGLTALALAALLLNALFVGDRRFLNLPDNAAEAIGFAITLICGMGLICLIEQIKREGADQRRAAAAARAATHALAALEQTVSAVDAGEAVGRAALPRAIVNAMVRVNRAHAGALFLVADSDSRFDLVASYGLARATGSSLALDGLIAEIARQRRPIAVDDLTVEGNLSNRLFVRSNLRAAIGVPIVGPEDEMLGVAAIGLLVEHHFTATEIARLEAIARRSALLLAAAEVADERETQLDLALDAERRMKMMIDAMPEAVIVAAPPDGRVVGYNAAAEALLGRLTDAAGPVDVAPRLRRVEGHPVNLHALPHLAALATGMTVEGVELVVTGEDGRETPVLASAAPIQQPDGTPAAVVTVFRDIAALKEAARLKDEFLSVVSHELRSPLTPILGFVQLVAKELGKAGGHDREVQRLDSVQGHVDRMNRLIEDLLDVSSLKSGTLDIRPEEVDLIEVCRDVAEGRSASAARHSIQFQPSAATIVGSWDADRLHQVVDNLVGNAIKYSPDGGTVTLDAWTDAAAGEAVLTVSDEGPGIASEDREQVFSAFYRTRDAAASQTAGLGLGLYICHELVAAHGGRIDVGEAPSGGAAFSVRLPLAAQVAAA